MKIENNVALIAGGASGLGAASARALAARGAKVVIVDQDHAKATQIASEINGYAKAADVTNAQQIEQVFQEISEQIAVPRICINCAGIAPAARIVGRQGVMPLAEFQKVISINLLGTFNVMRVSALHMSQLTLADAMDERGVIINTASIAAFEGQIGQAAYSASKGGIVAMTLPAARELARHAIRVMTIAPGVFATPMVTAMPEEVQQSLIANVPFPHRLGEAQEFAETVMHIIHNQMLNGSVIRLDGALRMGDK